MLKLFGKYINHSRLTRYRRKVAANSPLEMVDGTAYKLFLKVPWVNKQLASSDYAFRTRKKVADAKYGK